MPHTEGSEALGRANLWRHAEFLKLWIGQTVSVFGSQFTALALPLVAAQTLRATPVEMGVLASISTVPFLLFGLTAGVVVDRHRRRQVLIVGDAGRALALVAVGAVVWSGKIEIGLLYVAQFLVGSLTVFFDVAYRAYLPLLIDRDRLVEGNSKLEASSSVAQVAGPAVAGWVIQALSAAAAILVDAASFTLSALALAMIRTPETLPSRAERASMLREAREGISAVFGNPVLRALTGCTATFNFFGNAQWALYILFATRELGVGAGALGLVFGVGSIGSIVGAVFAATAARRLGFGRAIIWSGIVAGLGFLPIVFATRASAVPLLIAGWLLGAVGGPVYGINQVSLRQAMTPLALQGRVNATARFLTWGVMALGGIAGGVLGQVLDLRPALALIAVGALLSMLWVIFSPVRSLDRSPAFDT